MRVPSYDYSVSRIAPKIRTESVNKNLRSSDTEPYPGRAPRACYRVERRGRFRIFAFAGARDPAASGSAIRQLCDFLADSQESPVLARARISRILRHGSTHDVQETCETAVLKSINRLGPPSIRRLCVRDGGDLTKEPVNVPQGCIVVLGRIGRGSIGDEYNIVIADEALAQSFQRRRWWQHRSV
jgi:hypothetical protein